MNLNIRKVGVEQIRELRDIGIKSYLPHYTHLWKPDGIEWYMERCFGESSLQNDFSDPEIEYYIVENDGENIGIVKIKLKAPLPDSDCENGLYLEKIYFVKKWTGKGIGKNLIEFVLNRAEELGRDYVWLMAMDTSEKPIKAYESAGFAVDSYTNLGNDFELMKEEFRGMVVMKNCLRENGRQIF